MHENLTDLHLLRELEPVVEKNLNRHLSMRKDWNPHDYIPWSDGKNYYALGGQDWEPGQSALSEVAQVARSFGASSTRPIALTIPAVIERS